MKYKYSSHEKIYPQDSMETAKLRQLQEYFANSRRYYSKNFDKSSFKDKFDKIFAAFPLYFSPNLQEAQGAAKLIREIFLEIEIEALLSYERHNISLLPNDYGYCYIVDTIEEYLSLFNRIEVNAWGVLALHTLDACGYIREPSLKELWNYSQSERENECKILPYLLLRAKDNVAKIRNLALSYLSQLIQTEYIESWIVSLKLVTNLLESYLFEDLNFKKKLYDLFRTPEFKIELVKTYQTSQNFQLKRVIFDFIEKYDLLDMYELSIQSLECPDTSIRLKAARYLEKKFTKSNKKDLFQIMMRNTSDAVRKLAFIAYERNRDEEEIDYCISSLLDSNKTIRGYSQYHLKGCFDCKSYYYKYLNESACPKQQRTALIGLVET